MPKIETLLQTIWGMAKSMKRKRRKKVEKTKKKDKNEDGVDKNASDDEG